MTRTYLPYLGQHLHESVERWVVGVGLLRPTGGVLSFFLGQHRVGGPVQS